MDIERPKILYIIPFRARNIYRKKNIKIVLQWIQLVKKSLNDNFGITLDIHIVEQDTESYDQLPKENVSHTILHNSSMFNKGWSFNVIVKQHPDYTYYGFSDGDIIVPDVDYFCESLVENTTISPKQAFRPFTNRMDTSVSDCASINSYEDIVSQYPSIKTKLSKHGGLSFASNMIFISKDTLNTIGGWDESFRGWGRFDDFITHKLAFLCQIQGVYGTYDAVHLWHPITIDYSMNPENITLYDKYTKYGKSELLNHIETNSQNNGNPDLYKKTI